MGLLDSFMPGESSGIPNQGGLLGNSINNPLLQIGLGILANNNSRNLGQVVGKGTLAGIGNIQQAQHLAQQKKIQDYQMQEYVRKQKEYEDQQKALDAFKLKFPQYGEAVDLDPKLAIKAAYPQLAQNSADPYTTVEYDGNGNAYLFNHRSTDPNNAFQPIKVGGQGVIGAKYSPTLQGDIKQAESKGALTAPTMPVSPVKNIQTQMPDANVKGQFTQQSKAILNEIMRISNPQERANAMEAYRTQFANQTPPIPPSSNNPSKNTLTSVTPSNPASPFPSKLDQLRAAEQAKADIANKQQKDLADQKQALSAEKGTNSLNSMMRYLYPDGVPKRDSTGRLIPPDEPMVLGNSLTDRALMTGHEYGFHNDKASNVLGVRRLINNLVLDANNGSLGTGVSNADVEFLQKIQGVIEKAQDPKDIYNAIADDEKRFNRILGVAESGAGNNAPTDAPTSAQPVTAKVRKFNPTTGKIE